MVIEEALAGLRSRQIHRKKSKTIRTAMGRKKDSPRVICLDVVYTSVSALPPSEEKKDGWIGGRTKNHDMISVSQEYEAITPWSSVILDCRTAAIPGRDAMLGG